MRNARFALAHGDSVQIYNILCKVKTAHTIARKKTLVISMAR